MVNADDVFRFSLVQSLFEQQIVNTFAFRVESTTEPREDQSFLSSLFNVDDGTYTTNISDPLRFLQDDAVTHVRWEVQKVFPQVEAVYQFELNTTAEQDEPPQTANVAACITRFGAGGGRRQRGRIAIAGLPSGSYFQGKVTSITLGLLNLFKPNLHLNYAAPLGIFTLSTGFWSPEHDGMRGNQNVHYDAQYVRCVGAVVRNTVRVQRSRTWGVGS